MKKIVATSWYPGGINAIVPVIKLLRAEKKISVVVIGHQFSEKILQEKNIDYRTIISYGLKDVSSDSMIQLLVQEKPDLILTGTASQDDKNKNVIEQTITLAARNMRIKSLAVLDFWGAYSLRFSDIHTEQTFKSLPDKIAIMDEIAQKAMLEQGFDKTRLVITGNPHFDDLPVKARNFTDTKRKAIREKIELSVDLLLFFAANVFMKEKEEWGYWDLDIIRLINNVLMDLPERKVGVIMKLHPRMPERDIVIITRYLERNAEDRIKLVKNIDSQQLVLASDLTLIAFSTIGIEAVYMGKPCISLQPGLQRQDTLIVSQKGIIPVGYTFDDCCRELKKAILDDKYRQEELPKRAVDFKSDGKATKRVAGLVYKMLAVR